MTEGRIMAIIDTIFAKAKSNVKHIVLPEGDESRNIQAAAKVVREGIVLREKTFATVDSDRPHSLASLYLVHPRSAINLFSLL